MKLMITITITPEIKEATIADINGGIIPGSGKFPKSQ